VLHRGDRFVDAALIACLIAASLQIVPWPPAVRLRVSPTLASMDRALWLDAAADPSAGSPRPLAVDQSAAIEWLTLAAAVIAFFWCAREAVRHGRARDAVRAVGAMGGVAAALALVQHVTAARSLYWIWRPLSPKAEAPFTPFVNRNDMAAWMVMAIPLTAGYLLARIDARRRENRLSLDAVFDPTGVWVAVAICLMAAVLAATLSRSGLIAGFAAAASILMLSRGRMERRGRGWLLVAVSLVALVGAAYANLGALMTRVGEAVGSGIGGRREIWTLTLAIIRDFPFTGVGVGSFQRATSVYQGAHDFSFNHAHNEYLQIAAEGGGLLGIPAACAALAACVSIAERLRADRSPAFWMRAGAVSALTAIAVQSLWDTGLRMPANAVLFAVCAAVAIHEPSMERHAASRTTRDSSTTRITADV
jgi:hypothetical protein